MVPPAFSEIRRGVVSRAGRSSLYFFAQFVGNGFRFVLFLFPATISINLEKKNFPFCLSNFWNETQCRLAASNSVFFFFFNEKNLLMCSFCLSIERSFLGSALSLTALMIIHSNSGIIPGGDGGGGNRIILQPGTCHQLHQVVGKEAALDRCHPAFLCAAIMIDALLFSSRIKLNPFEGESGPKACPQRLSFEFYKKQSAPKNKQRTEAKKPHFLR